MKWCGSIEEGKVEGLRVSGLVIKPAGSYYSGNTVLLIPLWDLLILSLICVETC